MSLNDKMTDLANSVRNFYSLRGKLSIADMTNYIKRPAISDSLILDDFMLTTKNGWSLDSYDNVNFLINASYQDGYTVLSGTRFSNNNSITVFTRVYKKLNENINAGLTVYILIRKNAKCSLSSVPMWVGGYDAHVQFNVDQTDWTLFSKPLKDSISSVFSISYDGNAPKQPLVDIARITIIKNSKS